MPQNKFAIALAESLVEQKKVTRGLASSMVMDEDDIGELIEEIERLQVLVDAIPVPEGVRFDEEDLNALKTALNTEGISKDGHHAYIALHLIWDKYGPKEEKDPYKILIKKWSRNCDNEAVLGLLDELQIIHEHELTRKERAE